MNKKSDPWNGKWIEYNGLMNTITNVPKIKEYVRYLSPVKTLRITKEMHKKNGSVVITVTIGKPNLREKTMIKRHLKSGLSFPLKFTECLDEFY